MTVGHAPQKPAPLNRQIERIQLAENVLKDIMEMKKVLVIGYGSIGKRHTEVLQQMGYSVSIVSGHLEMSGVSIYRDPAAAFKANHFDYIVIATPTARHAETLQQLKPFLSANDIVFVEKPLFSDLSQLVDTNGWRIVVGYVLRAHPLLRRVKQLTSGRKLYSCRCSCGQYLPDWRPGTDYKKCYSAHRDQGGGVLRDLSHELDYLQMIAGCWTNVTAIGGKFSNLDIQSDDQFSLLMTSKKCPLCECHVDYLSRKAHRDLRVEFEDGSIHLDFIAGTLKYNGQVVETVKLERNDMFRTMHEEAMKFDLTYLASLEEAMNTMSLIEAAERAVEEKKWIQNQ